MMNSLRPYQARVVDSIGRSNALVKMPTGSGKTIVAAELVKRHLDKNPALASLFLVPTQDLVEQQALVVSRWCTDAHVFHFSGGLADPAKEKATGKVCLVSTPKAFSHLQRRKPGDFGWSEFGIVIFDEVHHLLKDHPYRHIALDLREWHDHGPGLTKKLQLVGLSASLTYGVEEATIRATLDRLCRELKVATMESPSLEELVRGGYTPRYGNNVELERSSDVPEGVLDRSVRKPHLMYETFMQRIQKETATSFSLNVWRTIIALEKVARGITPSFVSPLKQNKLVKWEECAHAHLMKHGTSVFRLLEVWYTALRLLVQSWEEDEVLVMQWLKQNEAFSGVDCAEAMAIEQACQNPASFFKLGRLRYHLVQKHENRGDSFRCIVFVQQRIAAYILSCFIGTDPELQRRGLRAGFVTAKEGKITPTIKMTKRMSEDTVSSFRDGKLNLIVATSVLEEGFDVPAANVVISYDCIKDSIELCQRSGRARQLGSSIVILDERPDRPLGKLETARDLQDEIAEQYDPCAVSALDDMTERTRQQDREKTASEAIFRDPSKYHVNPLACLNEYVKKTKASLSETLSRRQEGGGAGFVCTLTYRTILRTIKVDGHGTQKKIAKKESAHALLAALKAETYAQH